MGENCVGECVDALATNPGLDAIGEIFRNKTFIISSETWKWSHSQVCIYKLFIWLQIHEFPPLLIKFTFLKHNKGLKIFQDQSKLLPGFELLISMLGHLQNFARRQLWRQFSAFWVIFWSFNHYNFILGVVFLIVEVIKYRFHNN